MIAVALPGASEHALFPEVGSSAVVTATMRGDLETAAALADAVGAAEPSLGSQTCHGVRVVASTLEFFRGDLGEARRHAEAGVSLARPTNDPYELATALTMFGVAAGYAPIRPPAVPALDEAVRIAATPGSRLRSPPGSWRSR